MPTADICIGSYPSLEAQSLSVTVGATTEALVMQAGDYYLYDADAGLSLLTRLASRINDHSLLGGGVDAEVLQNRLVRITADDPFTLTWPADGVLRDLLGFTGNLSPAAESHTATNISPLLWSAARTAAYEERLGTSGIPVTDTAVGQSATGIVTSRSHNTYRRGAATWRYTANARVWTTSEAGGELYVFFREVLAKFRRFKIYRGITDDTGSTTAITFPASLPASAVGAYKYAPASAPIAFPWAREFGFKEANHPVVIPYTTTPEYT